MTAIEQGFVQREIQNTAYDFQRRVERGEQTIVGVNKYRSDEPDSVPILRIDPSEETERAETLKNFRSARERAAVDAALGRLKSVADSESNLLPAIREAVEAPATLGEISDALRDVFGVYE